MFLGCNGTSELSQALACSGIPFLLDVSGITFLMEIRRGQEGGTLNLTVLDKAD